MSHDEYRAAMGADLSVLVQRLGLLRNEFQCAALFFPDIGNACRESDGVAGPDGRMMPEALLRMEDAACVDPHIREPDVQRRHGRGKTKNECWGRQYRPMARCLGRLYVEINGIRLPGRQGKELQ